MRFQRSDLPGLAIAVIAPVLMTVLIFEIYELWPHHGSPLLGIVAAHVAIGAGVIAAFSRFITRWDVPLGLLAALALAIAGIVALQLNDDHDSAGALALRWAAIGLFLLLNLAVIGQMVTSGVVPLLDRRDARRAAQRES